MSQDKSSNLATIHAKIVDGLGHRKVNIKPHDCKLCGPKSICNVSTSSRNACLLERTMRKGEINSLNDDDTSILLPKEASKHNIIHFDNQKAGGEKSVIKCDTCDV